MLDWRSTGKDDLSYTPKYFPYIDGEGDKGIQIISSGPDTPYERIKQNYVKMISMAKKSIYIQTPYFVPDSSVIDSIKIAAMSGVDVRIMIPNKPDHPFVYWASLNYVGELLKFGVKVYTYENGFLHAKTMVVDDKISSVGTANFDVRSFKLNFEVNAIIYSKETSQILSNAFKKDIELSNELTRELYLERRLTVRFKESVSRLLSPIL
jgi:cardiolipin synthase